MGFMSLLEKFHRRKPNKEFPETGLFSPYVARLENNNSRRAIFVYVIENYELSLDKILSKTEEKSADSDELCYNTQSCI